MSKIKEGRDRHFCFTGFVPEEKEGGAWRPPEWDEKHMRYLVYQGEKCPKSGKFHWQGYVQFHNALRFGQVKELLGSWYSGWHIEGTKGNSTQASDYCKKSATACTEYFEFGKICNMQGQRTDLDTMAEVCKSGMWKNVNPRTYIKFANGFHKLADLMGYKQLDRTVRDWKPEVWVIIGAAGTGKSKVAWDILGKNSDTYRLCKGVTGWWWTGYKGQENVIIDDFHGDMDINMFLSILDRYPYQVQYHGGYTELLCKKIIITSTSQIADWFGTGKWNLKRFDEVHRRIDHIYANGELPECASEEARHEFTLDDLYG